MTPTQLPTGRILQYCDSNDYNVSDSEPEQSEASAEGTRGALVILYNICKALRYLYELASDSRIINVKIALQKLSTIARNSDFEVKAEINIYK